MASVREELAVMTAIATSCVRLSPVKLTREVHFDTAREWALT